MAKKVCYNTPTDAPRRNRMKKRLLCCLLAALILLTAVSAMAPRSLAADTMTTSKQLIAVLKKMEDRKSVV